MNLKSIAKNQTIIISNNGNELFFSYNTCVAAKIDGIYYRTEKKWSSTSSRHINQYIGKGGQTRPQSFFNNIK